MLSEIREATTELENDFFINTLNSIQKKDISNNIRGNV